MTLKYENWSGREHRVLFAGVGNVAPGMGYLR